MRDPLGLFPGSFNNLNSSNSTNNSFIITATHLRNPHIETAKDAHVGESQRDKKEKMLGQVRNTAL